MLICNLSFSSKTKAHHHVQFILIKTLLNFGALPVIRLVYVFNFLSTVLILDFRGLKQGSGTGRDSNPVLPYSSPAHYNHLDTPHLT
jgi:hypothetical protein